MHRLPYLRSTVLCGLFIVMPAMLQAQTGKAEDTRKLERALDYFSGQKYHEALLLLAALDRQYTLNPRFKAYLGMCYYHEWEYDKACLYLDECIPQLEAFSPQERGVYYHAAAESHFMLGQYTEAIPLYERRLVVCHADERADVLFHLGCCHLFTGNGQAAAEYLQASLSCYEAYPVEGRQNRITQISKMVRTLQQTEAKTDKSPSYTQ